MGNIFAPSFKPLASNIHTSIHSLKPASSFSRVNKKPSGCNPKVFVILPFAKAYILVRRRKKPLTCLKKPFLS